MIRLSKEARLHDYFAIADDPNQSLQRMRVQAEIESAQLFRLPDGIPVRRCGVSYGRQGP
jgi:hypothetical protein